MNEEKVEEVKKMWHRVNNGSLTEGERGLAKDSLCELVDCTEIARWLQQNVRELFEILMNMWDYNNDDPNAADVHVWMSRKNYFWRRCWDVLLLKVGWNGTFSVVLEVLPGYLNAPEWQKKYRAFIVLAQSIKDYRETQVKIENLEQVVPMVLSPFPNAHRLVRCAAIEAIQQFLTHLLCFRLHEEVVRTTFELVMSRLLSSFQDEDPVVQNASIRAMQKLAPTFGEHLQVACHLMLPALAEVMNDSPNQDMRASAASIILHLSKYCTQDNLKEHLEGRIRSCLIVSKEVKKLEMIIFLPERQMRWRLWHNSLSEEVDRLWEERLSEINDAWIQIWRNEERDFSPFLEILMSPVFRAAQRDPDFTRYDRLSIIEQKAEACHLLCFCVDELTELLVLQIGQVVDTLIPFLRWDRDPPVLPSPECYYAKAIRIAAVSAMPKILNSARKVVESSDPEDYDHAMQYVEELSEMVIGALNEALDVELDEDVRYDILDALNDCIQ